MLHVERPDVLVNGFVTLEAANLYRNLLAHPTAFDIVHIVHNLFADDATNCKTLGYLVVRNGALGRG
jgi:hypothetical protein